MAEQPHLTVTVVIPTLNSERYIDECLAAVRAQDYPTELITIFMADAGSTDRTEEIAKQHGVEHFVPNPLRTGEAGKAVGIHAATTDLICMVDSDNVILGEDWLSRMIAPFADPEVISSEALRWDYRRSDGYVNRYQGLTGINDPMCLWVGNYGRYSILKGKWTGYPYDGEQRDGWERVRVDPKYVPTMGANGYIVRRSAFDIVPVGDYLFDIDFVHDLVVAGHGTVARVDVAIRHYFCDGWRQFIRKTRRRTDDFFHFSAEGARTYPWTRRRLLGVLRFIVSTVLLVPLLVDVARGWRKQPDPAWLFHIVACWVTLYVYATGTIRARLKPPERHDRTGWQQ